MNNNVKIPSHNLKNYINTSKTNPITSQTFPSSYSSSNILSYTRKLIKLWIRRWIFFWVLFLSISQVTHVQSRLALITKKQQFPHSTQFPHSLVKSLRKSNLRDSIKTQKKKKIVHLSCGGANEHKIIFLFFCCVILMSQSHTTTMKGHMKKWVRESKKKTEKSDQLDGKIIFLSLLFHSSHKHSQLCIYVIN